MENIVNNSIDNICIVNLKGEIIFVNKQLIQTLNMQVGDMIEDYFKSTLNLKLLNKEQEQFVKLETNQICPSKIYIHEVAWYNMPALWIIIRLEADISLLEHNLTICKQNKILQKNNHQDLLKHLFFVQKEIIASIQSVINKYSDEILIEVVSFDKSNLSIKVEFIITKTFQNVSSLRSIEIQQEEFESYTSITENVKINISENINTSSVTSAFFDQGYNYVTYYPIFNNAKLIGKFGIQFQNEVAKISDQDLKFIKTQTANLLYTRQALNLYQNELIDDYHYISNLNYLQTCLEICTDFIGVFNKDGIFLSVSKEVTQILGWEPEDLIGKSWQDFACPEDIIDTKLQEYIGVNSNYNRCIVTSRFAHKNGEYRWIQWQFKPFEDPDISAIIAEDITAQMEFKTAQLQELELQKINTLRQDFFNIASHELRTPLTVIMSTHKLLEDYIDEHHLEKLRKHTNRLSRLVNNLITMTELETGLNILEYSPCNIVVLIGQIIEVINKIYFSKNISIVLSSTLTNPLFMCDVYYFQKIILNILSNAIKHSNDEGKILVELSLEKNFINISITNFGEAIPLEIQEFIFESFSQVDPILTRHNEGMGIGLSLCYTLIKMHKGHIYLCSNEEKTCFTINLPVGQLSDEPAISSIDLEEEIKLELSGI
ncbi:MAG: hypothetical protein ATN36_07440 [Epulopiscium sp. Nele67-Bin005]|nr:MAG: hypothetical protein ATN36_07440 [Epulopiscium sp. Nele67-Bin005]